METKNPRKDQFLYLSRPDIESIGLGMGEIIDLIALALRDKGRGRAEMPPKPGVHPGKAGNDNFLHAMPAFLPDRNATGMKWVGGFPDNPTRGLPYITGLLILNDPETGLPIAVMDCSWITAKRTAAASAVASRRLARKEPGTLAILGCGVQGRSHIEALRLVHPSLRRVQAFDILPERTRRFVEEMRSLHPDLDWRGISGPEATVDGADIIVTAGPIRKNPDPVIDLSWLREGALGIALDYDSYWKPEVMRGVDRFVTDDIPQLLRTREEGYFLELPDVDADLGEIEAGNVPGRVSEIERILCVNLGLAIYDIATASRLLELAGEKGTGTRLDL